METSLGDSRDDTRADRQLGRAEPERLARHHVADAVDLEHDTAGMDPRGPELRSAFTLAHAYLGRLCRDRHIRENADPDAPRALHVTRNGAPSRLNLARGDALRLQ